MELVPVEPVGSRLTQAYVTRVDGRCGIEMVEMEVYPHSLEGEILRNLRVAMSGRLGMVARALGIRPAQVSDLERGSAVLKTQQQWAEAYAGVIQCGEEKKLELEYTNHRGERTWRRVMPMRLEFMGDVWHPEVQWLLQGIDERKGERSFAVKGIKQWWRPTDVGDLMG